MASQQARHKETIPLDVQGGFRLCYEFYVPMREMRNWEPERITAFFDGIAQAIRARWGLCPDFAAADVEAVEKLKDAAKK